MRDDGEQGLAIGEAFRVAHVSTGRARLKTGTQVAPAMLEAAGAALERVPGVRRVSVRDVGSIVVEYDASSTDVEELLGIRMADDGGRRVWLSERVESETFVRAPVERVWELASDSSVFCSVGRGFALCGGDGGRGWTAELRVGGETVVEPARVRERVPGERLVVEVDGRLRARFTLVCLNAGQGVIVREALDYAPPMSALGRLTGRFTIKPRLRAWLEKHLATVRRLAEA